MAYTLRPRQIEAENKILDFVNNGKKNHGVFVYPTAFGKSLVISSLASKFPDKYFINVTSSKELLKQNYEKYTSYGFEANICSASLKEKTVGRVTFATIGTLIKMVSFFKEKDVVIVDDEAQEGSSTTSQLNDFIKQLKKYKLVGVTATPFRLSQTMEGTSLKMMNRDRKCLYKSIEDVVQISEVVRDNYWSKINYFVRESDKSSLRLNTTGTDYTDESVKKYNKENDVIARIVQEVKDLTYKGRKSILISVPFIEDAQKLEAQIKGCKAVYSGMDDKLRDSIISDFKQLKIPVVVQVKILSVGFDHPQLDALIMAKPTNSLTFYYQLIGRLVRIHDLKDDTDLIDFSGNYKKFGPIETLTIEDNPLTKGWAVFNGDSLLTNYPLNTPNRPTKSSLQSQLVIINKDGFKDPKFYFGKFKDKKVSEVIKKDKRYLTWLLDQKDFNWYGDKGRILKADIQLQLGVKIE